MIKYFIVATVAAFVVLACKPKNNAQKTTSKAVEKVAVTSIATKMLCRGWLDSREENKDLLLNYRPSGGSFTFPPSRGGRRGFAFAKDGTGAFSYPGPTDATVSKPIKWNLAKNILSITKDDKIDRKSVV